MAWGYRAAQEQDLRAERWTNESISSSGRRFAFMACGKPPLFMSNPSVSLRERDPQSPPDHFSISRMAEQLKPSSERSSTPLASAQIPPYQETKKLFHIALELRSRSDAARRRGADEAENQ